MMGFSPTIFASVDRTALFMYFGLLVLIYVFYKDIYLYEKKKHKYKITNICNYILVILAFFNILTIISTLLIIASH